MAKLPNARKMWLLRKLYAGNGGILPPTDPRILAMTEQQIDLEFEHFLLDKEERETASKEGKEQYEDDGYEDYDKETDEKDDRLFWEPPGRGNTVAHKTTVNLPKPEIKANEGEWEDVEIDDFEDW